MAKPRPWLPHAVGAGQLSTVVVGTMVEIDVAVVTVVVVSRVVIVCVEVAVAVTTVSVAVGVRVSTVVDLGNAVAVRVSVVVQVGTPRQEQALETLAGPYFAKAEGSAFAPILASSLASRLLGFALGVSGVGTGVPLQKVTVLVGLRQTLANTQSTKQML